MKKLNRREFVQTTTAAGVAAAAVPKTLFGQAPTVMTPKSVKPVVVASGNGNTSKDADGVTCVAKAFGMITQGRRRARCPRRRRHHRRARSESDRRRLERPAERRRRRAARCVAACTGRRSRPARVAGIEGVRAPAKVAQLVSRGDRPSSARRQGRAGLRARDGDQDRGRPDQREGARALARVEAPHRSAALSRSEEARAGVERRRPADGARRADQRRDASGARSTATASARRARSAA